ncbi:MAG: hypothetical protein VB064_08870 [Oscillospiraceae bacterium]|nr:hypothetical protein [Oscillospiraceae bacterium]
MPTTEEPINQIETLSKIYDRQHYFIDRHDSMAEKLMNTLLIELSGLTILYSLLIDKIQPLSFKTLLPLFVFVVLFTASLVQLILVIRPLSSKAKNEKDKSLLNEENKKWISDSSIYYRGIVSQIKKSLEEQKVPSAVYLDRMNNRNITADLIQQIFILAQYSEFKRTKLETAIKWIIATTVIGVVAATYLLYLST